MPKGDYLKLKADPLDGTTPLANLLLEAITISDLSGTEKSLLLHHIRVTFGWEVDGKRLKEAKLPQKELAKYLGLNERNVQRALQMLSSKNILLRKDLGQGKGYIYRINTHINTWDSGCIKSENLQSYDIFVKGGQKHQGMMNLSGDDKKASTGGDNSASTAPDNSASTGGDNSASTFLYINKDKEILNKEKEIVVEGGMGGTAAVFTFYQNEFSLITEHTKEMLNDWINQYTAEWVLDALKEGVKHNVKKLAYVEKILEGWKQNGKGTGKPKNKKTQGKLEGKVV